MSKLVGFGLALAFLASATIQTQAATGYGTAQFTQTWVEKKNGDVQSNVNAIVKINGDFRNFMADPLATLDCAVGESGILLSDLVGTNVVGEMWALSQNRNNILIKSGSGMQVKITWNKNLLTIQMIVKGAGDFLVYTDFITGRVEVPCAAQLSDEAGTIAIDYFGLMIANSKTNKLGTSCNGNGKCGLSAVIP